MTDLDALVPNLPVFEPGTVWLVGAGPGDPGLFTLAGLQAMRQADVIVHDALVGDGVMALAPPGTERDYAGKRDDAEAHRRVLPSDARLPFARHERSSPSFFSTLVEESTGDKARIGLTRQTPGSLVITEKPSEGVRVDFGADASVMVKVVPGWKALATETARFSS